MRHLTDVHLLGQLAQHRCLYVLAVTEPAAWERPASGVGLDAALPQQDLQLFAANLQHRSENFVHREPNAVMIHVFDCKAKTRVWASAGAGEGSDMAVTAATERTDAGHPGSEL